MLAVYVAHFSGILASIPTCLVPGTGSEGCLQERRPPSLDKEQRDQLKNLPKAHLLEMILPYVRQHVKARNSWSKQVGCVVICQVSELDAALVLQLMESEIAICGKTETAKKTAVMSRKLRSVFERMSLTGLVSTMCTILPRDRFPKILRKELERLRKVARAVSAIA